MATTTVNTVSVQCDSCGVEDEASIKVLREAGWMRVILEVDKLKQSNFYSHASKDVCLVCYTILNEMIGNGDE